MFLVTVFLTMSSALAGELTAKKHKRGRDYSYDPPFEGYNYPGPINPPLFDEPSTPPGLYDPPNHRPNATFPPFQDEIPSYLPPVYPPLLPPPQFDPIPDDTFPIFPPQDQYLPPSTLYGVPNVRVLNMSCLDATSRRFFRTIVRTPSPVDLPPVIDNARSDCVFGSGDTFRIDVSGGQMNQCGVRYCSGGDRLNLCMPLRFPTVRGLRLPEDTLVTLQCRPQERVVSQTKHLRVNPQAVQGRSAATVASGGAQRGFDTNVALLRKAPGSHEFAQVITPGSAVQLGEDLLLRASVRDGDGWKFSRLGTVTMQRIASRAPSAPARTGQDFAMLVDGLGCRVAAMRSVCPEHPRQVNPLVTTFPFRAFMFQGANSGDEMVLSVRMVGCLQHEDCFQRSCEEKVPRTRAKRETEDQNTTGWQSFLEFKVVLPELSRHEEAQLDKTNPAVLAAGLTVLVLLSVCLAVTLFRKK